MDSRPEVIRASVEGSLRRPRTDDEVAKVDELLDGLDLMVFGGHAVR